jgi:hypothetical protein
LVQSRIYSHSSQEVCYPFFHLPKSQLVALLQRLVAALGYHAAFHEHTFVHI